MASKLPTDGVIVWCQTRVDINLCIGLFYVVQGTCCQAVRNELDVKGILVEPFWRGVSSHPWKT